MRFLNLKFSIPEKKIDQAITLKPGENTIQTDADFFKELIPELPLIAIYGRASSLIPPAEIIGSDSYSITIEAEYSGKLISFTNKNGTLVNGPLTIPELISFDDFLLYSFFIPGSGDGGIDPVLKSAGLKKFLINREEKIEKSGSMHRLEDVIAEKEKEINSLKKNRELLELKKRKKDKLIKELSVSDRELGRLRRKRESYTAYKKTLVEILDLMQEESRLSSKIVNLKKDIIDIRDTADKREALEKEIAERFPQFTKGMIERLPDLDRLQSEFNAIRDINEEIERFSSAKKRKISIALKGIMGGLLFAFISMIFIFIKSISLNTITGMLLATLSSILVLLSAITGYYLSLQIRKNHPEELLNRKNKIESSLLETFTNGNFPEKNFGTGELYEYLFQYFEDFLSFREIQNELSAIKKGGCSRASLEEREGKLETHTATKDEIHQSIEKKLGSLDVNIHPAPARDNIKNLIPKIDEMIEEMMLEEKHKDSIAKKIESESLQYESGEKSRKTIDASIEAIDADIEKLNREISDISFMHEVYSETSDKWFKEKFSILADRCAEIYGNLTDDIKKNPKSRDSINELVLNGKRESFTTEETAAISIAMKLAISETVTPSVNYPLIISDPFPAIKPEIADKLKKILLELSEKRQVVIITSKSEKNLADIINIELSMDKNGQLSFSDDPLSLESSEIYQLISEGNFREAIKKADSMMNVNPEYPGLIEAFRTAKFWSNREKELKKTPEGKRTADFLMEEWASFEDYAAYKEIKSSAAYRAVMKFVFFRASEHYKLAFQKNEDTDTRFDLLLNLGECFLRLKEHKLAVETLEYAMNSYKSSARLLFILGESYYHLDDIPKSLLYMREAFMIDPSQIDLSLIESKPVHEIIDVLKESGRNFRDIREWIPIYGFITDIFYVRRNLSKHQVESLKREVFNLEKSYNRLGIDDIDNTNVLPRMINKYLWLLDYYESQVTNPENLEQIRSRLIAIDKDLFYEYFKKPPHKRHY